jgi:HPt (histidine-containing phosphotransfer) domain-containing protein
MPVGDKSDDSAGEIPIREVSAVKTEQLDGENLLTTIRISCATGDHKNGADTPPGQTRHEEAETRGPVIDMAVLDNIRALQREGTPNLVGKLVALYLTEASTIITTLGSAIGDKNTRDIFHLAHKLKSSSANVGALNLSSLLKKLETMGRQNETEGTASLFTAIEEEFKAVKTSLETLIPGAFAAC